jgi:succinoglycan biosynthesis protein ExoA
MTIVDPGTVTLIVPTYNEEAFIEECLASAVEDPLTEVLVVDGGSTDATREIVRRMTGRVPGLRLLDNPRRTAACAMNIGLAHATGEFIVRLDAHSVYPPEYVRRLVSALREHNADVAGGVWVARARKPTLFGRAIAASITNRWVMGNTGYRVGGGGVRVVDTVPFGCWHVDILRGAGGYNEKLHRSQDYDLSQRLKKMGAKIILVPDVLIEYQARSGVWENVRYTFWNGYWVGFPMVGSGVRFAARHLVAAMACVLGAALLAACWLTASPWPMLVAAPYLIVLVLAGLAASREGVGVALHLPLIAMATHVLYGLGTLFGLFKGALARWRRPQAGAGSGAPDPAGDPSAAPPARSRKISTR